MNPRERGFLLLRSHLGDPDRPVLSAAQLRTLAFRVGSREAPEEGNRKLSEKDLLDLGYSREMSRRIVALMEDEQRLDAYLHRGKEKDCVPITRASEGYPLLLRQRLGLDSPGCLWARGDLTILNTPAISLVGSRDLREENRQFAEKVGYEAAMQGVTLVSGNARGADRTAQDACLEAGGRVISIVADELSGHRPRRNQLLLSEEDFSEPFSAQRALSRNRCIHALGWMVFVAQSRLYRGGTWDGTAKNLQFGWSPVACFRDGSESTEALSQMGAFLVGVGELQDLAGLTRGTDRIYEI